MFNSRLRRLGRFSSSSSFMCQWINQLVLRCFEHLDGLLARHAGEVIQKLIQTNAVFQMIEHSLHWHARALEDGRAAEGLWVDGDQVIHKSSFAVTWTSLLGSERRPNVLSISN